MSKGIELELAVLRAIADEGNLPGALRLALGDSPWIVKESGVPIYHQPNYPLLAVGTTLLIGALSLPAFAAEQRSYRVEFGDSLWSIAQKELGSGKRWKELYSLNRQRIRYPSVIFPLQKILLPGKASTAVAPKKAAPKKIAALLPKVTPSLRPAPRVSNPLPPKTVQPTPFLKDAVLTSTPRPTPSPETPFIVSVQKPVPELTPTPSPTATPLPVATPAPSAPPKVSVKLGYWGANDETGTQLATLNSGMISAQLEVMPWGPDQAFGLSGSAMTYPANLTSGIWDAYYRSGILKAGYRSDDLLRRTIPYGNASKQDLHTEALIAGLAFAIPLGDALSLNFDLLGGSTFHNVAVRTPERVLTDLGVEIAFHPDVRTAFTLGYRSYVFGTFSDIRNTYTSQNARSATFGSYQGPTLSLSHRF